MNTPLAANALAVVPSTGVDLSDKEGYLVKGNGSAFAINDSATAPAIGVVLEGNDADAQSSVGMLGAIHGQFFLKAGAAITKLDKLQQRTDGTVEPDDGSGARVVVGIACEDAEAGALFRAALQTPQILS